MIQLINKLNHHFVHKEHLTIEIVYNNKYSCNLTCYIFYYYYYYYYYYIVVDKV